jgi:hypothetical protein
MIPFDCGSDGGPPEEVGIKSWPDVGRTLAEWPGRGAWVWNYATGAAWVWVDGAGRVQLAQRVPNDSQPGPLTRLRAWLGW